MTHSEFEELLSAYADGELAPAQREVIELHLTGCPDCRSRLAEFRLTRQQLALLGELGALAWQPDVVARVTARIQRRRRWVGFGRRLVFNAARALAVVGFVLAAAWVLRPYIRSTSSSRLPASRPKPLTSRMSARTYRRGARTNYPPDSLRTR